MKLLGCGVRRYEAAKLSLKRVRGTAVEAFEAWAAFLDFLSGIRYPVSYRGVCISEKVLVESGTVQHDAYPKPKPSRESCYPLH